MTAMTEVRPRSSGHPGYNLTKPREAATAEDARRLARVALAAWGLEAEAETAELVLSELVANAVRHAWGASVRIAVDRPADDRVRLAVVDRAPRRLPELRTPGPEEVCGRGLLLVKECADQWGYDLLGSITKPWGKCVWAELKVTS
ncbi:MULTISPECIES: ATP-binding protein [Streptomycetaceae]|uniref:Regulatory protein n=1 Tax=Streptantibioticus cattleyicolor (strain ATCC 35852 / DSM 46488 / JCM 4925 / NBRC 14057 / NRRL 8057) TaxID=1003195 RepID=F8JUL8_STREN|nr:MULTISPECIES: ATP-binding protein [Streptomycetaceae]AEW95649.1 regulatory protein [Streptantibioticus cattleyicolor NRRL 8057 = DSM 46488]MYS60194.1 ATP-binding protein [Streptomyces sp. SID5468]CCB75983.1 putative regulatory protein [Streptantibioticus cattleyicolor NRRL 8057 = DSM 46488]